MWTQATRRAYTYAALLQRGGSVGVVRFGGGGGVLRAASSWFSGLSNSCVLARAWTGSVYRWCLLTATGGRRLFLRRVG